MHAVTLTTTQYDAVYNALSFSIAAMGASFIALLLLRTNLPLRHRMAPTLGTLVMAVASYHYLRIFNSWVSAYHIVGGHYLPTGLPFNEGYRYVDWLLTVPLLLAEMVVVLRLPSKRSRSMLTKLIGAAVLMIVLGYPGQIAPVHSTSRTIWAVASTVFFVYILYVLVVELGRSLDRQGAHVRSLVNALRIVLLASWGFYPVAYLLPSLVSGASGVVISQVGYSVADVIAKPVFTLLIFWIATLKTEEDAVTIEATSDLLAA
ncbi:MAG: bacteriorhodopsin-like [Acidimicrobiales bacterium]